MGICNYGKKLSGCLKSQNSLNSYITFNILKKIAIVNIVLSIIVSSKAKYKVVAVRSAAVRTSAPMLSQTIA